jgi:hypothetical protein
MKKISIKKQLEITSEANCHLINFSAELIRCSISDTMGQYIISNKNFKYDKENIEAMFRYVESDMYWYKQQIETCCIRAFPKPEYAEQMYQIIWEEAGQRYIDHMKKGLLRKASRLKAKETLKKGTSKNETRVRTRTKR